MHLRIAKILPAVFQFLAEYISVAMGFSARFPLRHLTELQALRQPAIYKP
jgi:hypothetical protein